MTLMEYWVLYGKGHCVEMCKNVDTSYEYFKHMCNKRKRPSVELARKMIDFSGGELTLNELLFPMTEKKE